LLSLAFSLSMTISGFPITSALPPWDNVTLPTAV
jgi:hypothetical protein